ncbi:hypothetical protein Tco_0410422 [Tanacetum coccineum]
MNMSQHLKSLGRSSSRSKILRPSKRFFSPGTHCGCIDNLSNECLYYPICGLFGSYNHDTNGHNRIISLEREINPRNPQHAFKRCEVCGSSTHTTTDHYDIKWFKRGEALQAKKAEALKSTRAKSSNANRSKTPTKSGCSRHMTGVKSYLHKYVEQPGPKVVFRDDFTCTTEGYNSIECNGIVFTKVAFVDGLKYNLISISQLYDAKYIVQFDEKEEQFDNINIAENERYPPDEYLHPYEPSQSQTDQNDQTIETDEILNDNLSKHSNHNNVEQIIDNLPNTKNIQTSEHSSSPNVEDTSVQDTISIPNPPLPIPLVVTPSPQDRWSQDKHIEIVNIIGNLGAEMLTRAMAKQLSVASTHECLFVDFLSKKEPKKVFEALKHPGWVNAMQDELNQFA